MQLKLLGICKNAVCFPLYIFSLDSEFLASTSTDGSAKIWKTEDGVPVTTLTRNSGEKIELCRFSKDAWDKFLHICTIQKVKMEWTIQREEKVKKERGVVVKSNGSLSLLLPT